MRVYAGAEEAALESGDPDTAVRLNLDMWVRGQSRTWNEPLLDHAESVREAVRVSLVNQSLSDEYGQGALPDLVGALGETGVPALVAVGTTISLASRRSWNGSLPLFRTPV